MEWLRKQSNIVDQFVVVTCSLMSTQICTSRYLAVVHYGTQALHTDEGLSLSGVRDLVWHLHQPLTDSAFS